MGAFFLYQNDTAFDKDAVRGVFQKKGFIPPKEFVLGDATLWLYRKQLVDDGNDYFADPQTAVFATGTIVYRGKSYRESLAAALEDYRRGEFDWNEAIGSFCLLFWDGGRLRLATDRLNVQHLFVDEAGTRLSTSFLAMLVSHRERLPINRLALYEKLATGYIVGPDTLVYGIRQLTEAMVADGVGPHFSFLPHPARSRQVSFASGGFDAAVRSQIDVLGDRFRRIGPLAQQYGVEHGLSAGYDSRLVFALCDLLPVQAAVHTHSTGAHHATDRAVAEELARLKGRELVVVPTCPVPEQEEADRARMLTEVLYYFDGRCSDNSGTFSQTYTRDYRIQTLRDRRLTLSGLGGEMYRNHYDVMRTRVDFQHWMLRHVYYDFFGEMFARGDLRHELHHAICTKMEPELGVSLRGAVAPLTIHRYYAEVNQPQCEGAVVNAHNQMSFFLAPFIEYSVACEAYKVAPYLGLGGRFEAAMIAKLDQAVANVPTSGGHALAAEPLRERLRAAIKTSVPNRILNWKTRFDYRWRGKGQATLAAHRRLLDRSPVMREIERALTEFAPDLCVDAAMRGSTSRGAAIFVGSFLREFHDHISHV